MSKLKSLAGAFLVGGLFSLIGQLALAVCTAFLGADSNLLIPVWLVTLGLIGAILFILGIYQKLEIIGGIGAVLCTTSLPPAIAGIIVGNKRSGGSVVQGFITSLKLIGFVILIGAILSVIVAIIKTMIG